MTVAQAAFLLMRLGWIPVKPGEKIAPGKGRNQCGQCLAWTDAEPVRLTSTQRIELCVKCR